MARAWPGHLHTCSHLQSPAPPLAGSGMAPCKPSVLALRGSWGAEGLSAAPAGSQSSSKSLHRQHGKIFPPASACPLSKAQHSSSAPQGLHSGASRAWHSPGAPLGRQQCTECPAPPLPPPRAVGSRAAPAAGRSCRGQGIAQNNAKDCPDPRLGHSHPGAAPLPWRE